MEEIKNKNMNTFQKTKEAYEEILSVLNKHRDIVNYSVEDLDSKAKLHLFGIELSEQYGLNIIPKEIYSMDYNRKGDYMAIGWWGKKYNRTISWEDNGKQPKDELLLSLNFPTGAYIFGEDYPEEFFKEFWQELKSYNPKYIDTVNKNLYWSIENAKNIFNIFPDIIKRYYEKNIEDKKHRKIKELKKELELLQK